MKKLLYKIKKTKKEAKFMTEQEIEKAKAAKARYLREYARRRRRENPEAAREADLRYWLKRAEREAAEQEKKEEVEQDARDRD